MFFHRYAERLEKLARYNLTKLAQRQVDPADIVQSVFRRFFATVDRGNYEVPRGADLWSLLMVIALNRVRSEETSQRSPTRDVRRTISFHDHQQGSPVADPLTDDEQELSQVLLREAVLELSERHRAVVELRLKNHEVDEIATAIGRSKRTTERLLQEAKARLIELLEPDRGTPNA